MRKEKVPPEAAEDDRRRVGLRFGSPAKCFTWRIRTTLQARKPRGRGVMPRAMERA
jgi:hypothetical protein